MIGDLRLSDAQVRAMLDAFQRADNEIVCEPTTRHRLRAKGMGTLHLTDDRGYILVMSSAAQDLVWGWHNPDFATRPDQEASCDLRL